MKKFYLPFIILTALAAIQAAGVLQMRGTRGPRVKAVINLRAPNAVVEYDYMTSGNVAQMRDLYGYTTLFTYKDTIATRQLSNQPGVDTFILNKQGLAKQSIAYSNVRYRFTYNSDGFLIKAESYFAGRKIGADQYTVEKGDIQCLTKLSANDIPKTRTCYTYYTKADNTIGNANLGLGFLGRSSKNLVKESVTTGLTGDTTLHLFYHYHFDKQKRVREKISYRSTGQLEDSVRYVYLGE